MKTKRNIIERQGCLMVSAIFTSIIAFLAPSSGFGEDPRQFDTWTSFDTGLFDQARYPSNSTTADLNNDGVPDLAVVHWWNVPKLSVLLGRGDGTFQLPVHYPAESSYHVKAADFDGDGAMDLVVSDYGTFGEHQTVSLYFNRGDGTLGAPEAYTVGSGPMGMAPADYDGDTDIDLAVALNGGTQIALLTNNGTGTFSGPVKFPAADPNSYSLPLHPYRIEAGDLNGDQLLDLAVGLGNQRTSVLINDGQGGFLFPATYVIPGSYPNVPGGVALTDADHDGDLDLLYSSTSTRLLNDHGAAALLRNNGDGTLQAPELIALSYFATGDASIRVGDLNNDTWDDIFAAYGDDGPWGIALSDGAGGFLPASDYTSGYTPTSVDAADTDGDGDLDMIVTSRNSLNASVHLNPGNADFSLSPVYPAGSLGSSHIDEGDIDADGDLDIALSEGLSGYGGSISILRNQGNGTFGAAEVYDLSQGARSVKLRDLDNDGDLDLVWADAPVAPPYNFHTRLNNGDGTFGPLNTWYANTCGTWDLETVDVDHDGDLDVILAEALGCFGGYESFLYLSLNNGNGTFQPAYLLTTDTTGQWGVIGGDFNEDGFVDLASTSVLGIDIFPGSGDGSFDSFTLISGLDEGQRVIAAVDVNGDNHLDLVTQCNAQYSLWVVIGHGDGTFDPPVRYEGSNSVATSLDTGDVDGDGDVDIFISNYYSNEVSLFTNRGDGTFARQKRYGASGGLLDLRFADFTGDGTGDLAVMMSVAGFIPFSGGGVQILPGMRTENPMILDLVQDPLVRGQPVDLTVSGAVAGERVFYLMSLAGTGSGPCPPQLGGMCLDLLEPIQILGTAVADVEGQAVLTETVPQNAPLVDVHTQAVIRRGNNGEASVKSNTVTDQIQP